jgi:hypothetical protein
MIILFWMLAAYGMTCILVWGSIFNSTREFIKKHSQFFGTLIGCVLCTSTWVGFFMSLVLGGLSNHYFTAPWFVYLFFDGMFSAGSVWAINAIIEWFEENRPK